VPAAERDRDHLARLAEALEASRMKRAADEKAAELAKARALVAAADGVPLLGHNGGPALTDEPSPVAPAPEPPRARIYVMEPFSL